MSTDLVVVDTGRRQNVAYVPHLGVQHFVPFAVLFLAQLQHKRAGLRPHVFTEKHAYTQGSSKK